MTLLGANYLTNAAHIGWVVANELVDITAVLDAPLHTTTLAGNRFVSVGYSSIRPTRFTSGST